MINTRSAQCDSMLSTSVAQLPNNSLLNINMQVFKIFIITVFLFSNVFLTPISKEEEHKHHESFVGVEEAKLYDKLSPEKAKEKLGLLVSRIDSNKDELVSKNELISWIDHLSNTRIFEDIDYRWPTFKKDENGNLDWDSYLKTTYRTIYDNNQWNEFVASNFKKTYGEQRDRDQYKFNTADTDKDGKLSVNEFKAFVFPHSFSHMREVAIQEHLLDMDFDKSNSVIEAEYIKYVSLITKPEDFKQNREGYKTEFQQRDLNSDGSISREELATWVLPEGFNRSEAEAVYLLSMADDNKDGKLSKREIVDHHEVFTGSAATQYGRV